VIRLMVPMASNVEEVVAAKELLLSVQEELAAESIAYDEEMLFGIMVETPAVALAIEDFVELVDFFSIGTNDLIQYTLGVDRTNEHVADLYQPGHPAVLRQIHEVIEAGKRRDVPVSMCGQMCADPTFVIFLLGMGLRDFSVPPPLIPEVKKLIRSVSIERAEEVAREAMSLRSSRELTAYLRHVTGEVLPEWLFM
jgi:phosphotransferase system enzyme I (PtsI)